MIAIHICGTNSEVIKGLEQLAQVGLIKFANDGQLIEAVKQDGGLKISRDVNKIIIGYSRLAQFFRGISYLIQGVDVVDEQPAFANNGYMLDCSRNAVASVSAVKWLIRYMGLSNNVGYWSCCATGYEPRPTGYVF